MARYLSAEQLLGWMRYEREKVGRFGRDRDDVMFAKIAWLVERVWGGDTGSRLVDHMPYYDEFAEDMTAAQLRGKIRLALNRARAFKGKSNGNGRSP